MDFPLETYQSRIALLTGQRKQAAAKQNVFAWLRFATAIVIALSIYFLYDKSWTVLVPVLAALIAIFLRLVVLASRNNARIKNLDLLLQINREEIEISEGNYVQRPDGAIMAPPEHPYADDLDIFGRASIYQYINRTTSEQGSRRFADWLLSPAESKEVMTRQLAAKELAPNLDWRQQFMAHGMANTITKRSEANILTWLTEPVTFQSPTLTILRFLLPAIILAVLVAYLFDLIPAPIFSGIAFLFFLGAGIFSLKVTPLHRQLNLVSKEIQTLYLSLKSIEELQPNAEKLREIHSALQAPNASASEVIRQLTIILERMEVRMNPFVFVFLNTFLFWDLQQGIALNKWKKENASLIPGWFEALAETEALQTIASIYFNHPQWSTPLLVAEHGRFEAVNISHPLIPASRRVASSFTTTGEGKIALVTGSNMAGKSTFLRSIGVNQVLAMLGSPVCATALTVSPMRVMSSMRIKDNLEESTSTFYAELKKLKQIIDAANRQEKIFILLDEILRGTNSLDRHTGSEALIRQLLKVNAVGILATHDLQLASLNEEFPANLTNYHFDVQIQGEELYFDYKLKPGVCESMNAVVLMKKIGIQL